jgi:Kip1 ubiquitination-promoting complex protein 1
VIGCCIDLDGGQISFYRNGVSLGVAFGNVRCGENAVGLAYFPAVSLSYGERCCLNFGSRPLSFPGINLLRFQLSCCSGGFFTATRIFSSRANISG